MLRRRTTLKGADRMPVDNQLYAGLEPRHTVGLGPARNPISMLLDMRRRARGDMTFREFGARNKFREMRDKSMLSAGHAVKPA